MNRFAPFTHLGANRRGLRIRIGLLALSFSGFVQLLPLHAADNRPSDDPAKVEFFEKKIRPLLLENCINCHSAENGGKGGLRVDDRNGLIEGGGRGPGLVPGKPQESLLIKVVRHQGLQMPPQKKLTDDQIADLEKWILDGATWPAVEIPDDLTGPKPEYDELKRNHWAWQPLKAVVPPTVTSEAFAANPIDQFIFSKWAEAGLQPAPDADKIALIRRVTFDLTGIPPTVDEIDRFLSDDSDKAFEKVVDRLLKSSAYGERWGRHWLDLARYGESTGSARNIPLPHAWRYRDYVIDSFTNDKPYDQFIREQIAGDLLPANSPTEKAEQLIATGFLAIGVKDVNQRFKIRFIMDNVDEQIDTVTRSVLALTASCARCHDHKFDPIPAVDYYALAGIFQSSDLCAGVRSKMGGGGLDYYDNTLLLQVGADAKTDPQLAEKIEAATQAFEKARAEFEAIRGTPEGLAVGPNGKPKQQAFRARMNKAQQELLALTDPAVIGKVAYGVRDGKKISDTEVRIRGEAELQGPTVPRGFLSLLEWPEQPKVNPKQSGRLELAEWLTSEQNPLTQRVIVNRIWQHLFQRGIVSTVDNFGTTGDKPSHPELLDYLAKQFVDEGWSVKKLIRSIVLSHTYRLSADSVSSNLAIDPGNRFLWRHSPRRLDAEEIRDAMLAASGQLNPVRPEGSPAKDFKVIEMRNNGPEARNLSEQSLASVSRSIYLPLVRGVTPRSLEVFDFAEQGMVTGSRDTTTVPTQALYLLNDPFVRKQALALAERVVQQPNLSDVERVNLVYRLALGRQANPTEIERATGFVAEIESATQPAYAAAEVNLVADAANPATPATLTKGPQGNSRPQAASDATAAAVLPVIPVNPDDIDPVDAPVKETVIEASDARTAAWWSFCQAVLGAAEFQYLK